MATRSESAFKNLVPGGGARVASVSEFAVNQRYSTNGILLPDRNGAFVQGAFSVPVDYVGSPSVNLVFACVGSGNTVRLQFEYNVIVETQTIDPGTADETLAGNESEGANPGRLRVLTAALTAANFTAGGLMLYNVIRLSTAGGDDSYAPIILVDTVFSYSDA